MLALPILLLHNLVSAIVAVVASVQAGVATYSVLAYLAAAALWVLSTTKPGASSPFCLALSPPERETFRSYFAAIAFPGAAIEYSRILDGMRLIGFIWAIIAFVNGLAWLGIAQAAYFFVVGFLVVTFNPILYMSRAGPREQAFASVQLTLLHSVRAKWEAQRE